jgi:hypothetical protein
MQPRECTTELTRRLSIPRLSAFALSAAFVHIRSLGPSERLRNGRAEETFGSPTTEAMNIGSTPRSAPSWISGQCRAHMPLRVAPVSRHDQRHNKRNELGTGVMRNQGQWLAVDDQPRVWFARHELEQAPGAPATPIEEWSDNHKRSQRCCPPSRRGRGDRGSHDGLQLSGGALGGKQHARRGYTVTLRRGRDVPRARAAMVRTRGLGRASRYKPTN